MEKDKLPIKFFATREVDELRIEGNRNTEKPKWVLRGEELKNRADYLKLALDDIEDDMRRGKIHRFRFHLLQDFRKMLLQNRREKIFQISFNQKNSEV